MRIQGRLIIPLVVLTKCFVANATGFDVENALRATYNNCVGIENSLHDMKVMAGINTAISGVGTGLGIGATVVGVAKSRTDSIIEEKYRVLENLSYAASSDVETMDEQEWLRIFEQNNGISKGEKDYNTDSKNETDEIRKLTEKSKKLGDWRTGLLVGNAVTNVAGAVISGTNKVDSTLSEQIRNCNASVKNLQKAIAQARIDNVDVTEAIRIESACNGFEYIDAINIEKINNQAKGGMIASVVGTGTGVVGAITSAMANSDKIRNNDTEKKKEKNLNTAANAFAVGSTVASGVATIFNATQIKAIKNVVSVAEKCTEALR